MLWEDEVAGAVAHWGPVYGITIDPALVHAIIERESAHGQAPAYVAGGGVVNEPNGHKSYGPMQVYDTTIHDLNSTLDPNALAQSPALGIWYGTHYLAILIKKFPRDLARAVAAYNTGPGNAVRNQAGNFPNQSYVDFVLSFLKRNPVASVVPMLVLAGAVWFVLSRQRKRAA